MKVSSQWWQCHVKMTVQPFNSDLKPLKTYFFPVFGILNCVHQAGYGSGIILSQHFEQCKCQENTRCYLLWFWEAGMLQSGLQSHLCMMKVRVQWWILSQCRLQLLKPSSLSWLGLLLILRLLLIPGHPSSLSGYYFNLPWWFSESTWNYLNLEFYWISKTWSVSTETTDRPPDWSSIPETFQDFVHLFVEIITVFDQIEEFFGTKGKLLFFFWRVPFSKLHPLHLWEDKSAAFCCVSSYSFRTFRDSFTILLRALLSLINVRSSSGKE